MRRALALARRAEGWTSPNPMVGSVILKHGHVIAEGYHRRAGLPHAEVEALSQAGARAKGATLYVTLEPCNHFGRTPPCCRSIIDAGISEVIVGTRDPNPLTDGRGVAALRRSGIRVTIGVLRDEADRLIEPFRKVMSERMPYVIAKVGQSLDGKIATAIGESRWITSKQSRRLAHEWRWRVDAVLVGITTVLQDDPQLTVRGIAHRSDRPIRVVIDSRLQIPKTARCLARSGPPVIIATTTEAKKRRDLLDLANVEIITLPPQRGRVPLAKLFRLLATRGIQSILIEGGSEVLSSAFMDRLVDHFVVFIAPVIIGGRTAPGSVGGSGIKRLAEVIHLCEVTWRQVGPDLCVEACVVYPKQ